MADQHFSRAGVKCTRREYQALRATCDCALFRRDVFWYIEFPRDCLGEINSRNKGVGVARVEATGIVGEYHIMARRPG